MSDEFPIWAERLLRLIEKAVVPIVLIILTIVANCAGNRIANAQLALLTSQEERQKIQMKENRDLKYLELFWQDINSTEEHRQNNALALLRIMNSELAYKLAVIASNSTVSEQTRAAADQLVQETSEILNSSETLRKGVELARSSRYSEAIAEYDKVPNDDPQYFLALSYKGYVLYKLGRGIDAKNELLSALARKPNHAPTLFNLVLVLWSLEERSEALSYAQELVELDPSYKQRLVDDRRLTELEELASF